MTKRKNLERGKMESSSRSRELCDKIMLKMLNNEALAAGWIDERTKLRIDREIEMIAR